jgi:hypothetical protein
MLNDVVVEYRLLRFRIVEREPLTKVKAKPERDDGGNY